MADPPQKLTYGDMTWDLLEEKYAIQEVPRQVLLEESPLVEPSAILTGSLKRGRRGRLVNERDRAYRLIQPVLCELEALRPDQLVALPEISLEVKGVDGLCGKPDFILSGSVTHKLVPIMAIVEAKKDNIDEGMAPCVAELYAAYLLNGQRPALLYGCVTTGDLWQLVRLEGSPAGRVGI